MAEGAEGRFAHLLAPLRDLAQSWRIDIASELETYLEELDTIQVELGAQQLNFIEAALVVQGSTMVYSKKVECLHHLVYQALEHLTSKRKEDKSGKTKGPQQSLEDASHLLAIEVTGASPLLTEVEDTRPPSLKRLPLYLMPRDVNETKRLTFKITTCTLHKSMCLLEASDALQFDVDTSACPSTPLLPPPPMRDFTAKKARLSEEMEAEHDEPEEPEPAAPPTQPTQTQEDKKEEPPVAEEDYVDPWAPLDPHEVSGKSNPLKVGNMSKRPPQRLLRSLEETPLHDPFDDSDLFEMGPLKSILRRLGLESMQDLDHLVVEEMARGRKRKQDEKRASMAAQGVDELAEAPLLDPMNEDDGFEDHDAGLDDREERERASLFDDFNNKAAEIEREIERAQRSYEEVVRQHLEKIGGYSSSGSEMTHLYANVRKWQDGLEPILAQEAHRPKFDIHGYGRAIVGAIEAADPVGKTGSFAAVVADKPKWEVCRYFLAALVLTNNGNVDISGNTDFTDTAQPQFTHPFELAVLDGDRPISYDENEGPGADDKKVDKKPEASEPAALEDSPHPAKKSKKKAEPEPAELPVEAPKKKAKKKAALEPAAPEPAAPEPAEEAPKKKAKKAKEPEPAEPQKKKSKKNLDSENAPPNALEPAKKAKKEVLKEEPLSQGGKARRAKA